MSLNFLTCQGHSLHIDLQNSAMWSPSPAAKFAELLCNLWLWHWPLWLLSVFNWLPECLCLSEKRYGWVYVQVTFVCLAALCVSENVCLRLTGAVAFNQSSWRTHGGLEVSINHCENRGEHGKTRPEWVWQRGYHFVSLCFLLNCLGSIYSMC